MPAFTHGQQRQKPVVPGLVAGDVAAPAEQVGERVDAERGVPDCHRAPAEADHQSRQTGDKIGYEGEKGRGQKGMPIKPPQLRVVSKVAHRFKARLRIARHEDPAKMRVKKTSQDRRVHIELGIRILVVPAMMGGPP